MNFRRNSHILLALAGWGRPGYLGIRGTEGLMQGARADIKAIKYGWTVALASV